MAACVPNENFCDFKGYGFYLRINSMLYFEFLRFLHNFHYRGVGKVFRGQLFVFREILFKLSIRKLVLIFQMHDKFACRNFVTRGRLVLMHESILFFRLSQ